MEGERFRDITVQPTKVEGGDNKAKSRVKPVSPQSLIPGIITRHLKVAEERLRDIQLQAMDDRKSCDIQL